MFDSNFQNIIHEDDRVTVTVLLPDVEQDNIDLSLLSGMLTVKYVTNSGDSFSKSYWITERYNQASAYATFKGEVLCVVIKQLSGCLPYKIKISPNATATNECLSVTRDAQEYSREG